MKNKKLILAVIALVAAVAVMLGLWMSTRNQPVDDETPEVNQTADQNPEQNGEDADDGSEEETTEREFEKYFTLEVVHSDGSVKTFTIGTNEEYLGAVLVAEGLIVEGESAGMYNTVDGETADWDKDHSYWAFYVNGEYGMEGVDTTVIEDGAVYKWEYTLG